MLVGFALRVLAPEEPERAGLTAEADIPGFLEIACGILSKDTARRLKTDPFRASRARCGELKCANGESQVEILVDAFAAWVGRRAGSR